MSSPGPVIEIDSLHLRRLLPIPALEFARQPGARREIRHQAHGASRPEQDEATRRDQQRLNGVIVVLEHPGVLIGINARWQSVGAAYPVE